MGGPGGNTKFVKSLEIRVKNGKQIKISQRSCSKLATIVIKIIVFYSKGGDLEADEPTKHSAPVPSKKKFGSLTLPLHTVHQLYSELSHLSFADWLDGELLLFLLLLLAFIVLLLLSEGAAGGRMVQDGGAHG